MAERPGRWLFAVVGLIVIAFELITIIGVGLELARNGPSTRNRVFGTASLGLAAASLAVLAVATKNRWLPKAVALVAASLIGVFLIAIAPSGS